MYVYVYVHVGVHVYMYTKLTFRCIHLSPECDCFSPGTLNTTNLCDKTTGQCVCKTNVMGTRCDTCKVHEHNYIRDATLVHVQ